MVAFFENCDILIKDKMLKRRVHGVRDSRERQAGDPAAVTALFTKRWKTSSEWL